MTERRRSPIRWIFAGLLVVHGAIHVVGFVEGFDLAEVSQLSEPIGKGAGVLWLLASLALFATAGALVWAPRAWWTFGIGSVALSQSAIATAWSDAAWGTVANGILFVAAAHNLVAEGPFSLRSRYRREVAARPAAPSNATVVTEDDLAPLPPAVRRYVRMSGAVGRPRVESFRAAWRGRIRGGPEDRWMTFTAGQYNFVREPSRFFLMKARRAGLPIDVLHMYRGRKATMEGRLLSAFPVVKASGPQMTRAETVTLLNDLCILAPGALIHPSLRWEPIDEWSVRATYTVGDNTVDATLTFNERDELVDFVSDDRMAMSPDGSQLTSQRWSTPLWDYRDLGSQRIWTRGEGRWHPKSGTFTYLEGELLGVEANPEP